MAAKDKGINMAFVTYAWSAVPSSLCALTQLMSMLCIQASKYQMM